MPTGRFRGRRRTVREGACERPGRHAGTGDSSVPSGRVRQGPRGGADAAATPSAGSDEEVRHIRLEVP